MDDVRYMESFMFAWRGLNRAWSSGQWDDRHDRMFRALVRDLITNYGEENVLSGS